MVVLIASYCQLSTSSANTARSPVSLLQVDLAAVATLEESVAAHDSSRAQHRELHTVRAHVDVSAITACGPHFRGFMQVLAVSSSTGHVPSATSSRQLRPVAWPEEMSTLHPDPYQFGEALRAEMEHADEQNAEMASPSGRSKHQRSESSDRSRLG